MKKAVIFGAGQIGTMFARLLGKEYRAVCFADNSEKKQGTLSGGLPVLSLKDALGQGVDCCVIGVLDEERAGQMERQLADCGFSGEILRAGQLNRLDPRLATMRLWAEALERDKVEGDIAELGVFRGEFAAHINAAFRNRRFHLFDTFEGFASSDLEVEQEKGFFKNRFQDFSDTCQELVLERMPFREQAVIHKGHFPETFDGLSGERFAFVSLDADLYEPTVQGLRLFYECLSPGGVIMVHDYNSTQYEGVKQAVDEFCEAYHQYPIPVCDLHGSAVIRKPRD